MAATVQPMATRGLLAVLLAVLVAAPLAGCTQPTPEPGSTSRPDGLPAIDWSQPLAVATVPTDPGERTGQLRVAWNAQAFAVWNERETDLDHSTLVLGDGVFTSNARMGWTQRPLEAARSGELSNRLVLWDLRGLLAEPGLDREATANGTGTDIVVRGRIDPSGLALTVEAQLHVEGGRVVRAVVRSPQGREAPYTFTPAPEAFPFDLVRPSHVLPQEAVAQGNGRAQPAHVQIIQLVQAYSRNHAGTMPDRIDAQTLRVEVAQSGKAWPVDVFDDTPVSQREESGHVHWTRCGLAGADYIGYGWDGALITQAFNGGCSG